MVSTIRKTTTLKTHFRNLFEGLLKGVGTGTGAFQTHAVEGSHCHLRHASPFWFFFLSTYVQSAWSQYLTFFLYLCDDPVSTSQVMSPWVNATTLALHLSHKHSTSLLFIYFVLVGKRHSICG